MRRLAVLAFVLGCGQPTYVATGDVVAVDPAALEVTIRHEDIPGLMGAMTMPFHLRSADVLAGIGPGPPARSVWGAGGRPGARRVWRGRAYSARGQRASQRSGVGAACA